MHGDGCETAWRTLCEVSPIHRLTARRGSRERAAAAGAPRGIPPARERRMPTSRAFIGISGYDYKPWRGRYYPDDLPARRWLEYASSRFNSIQRKGTFYRFQAH